MEPVPLDCPLCLLVHDVFDAMASHLAIFSGDSEVLCLFTQQDRREAKTTRLFTFDLRWPSGTLIKHFEVFDLCVERFKQDMDEGRIAGIPPAATDIAGNWLKSYYIAWGTQVLQDGLWLSDYIVKEPHSQCYFSGLQ